MDQQNFQLEENISLVYQCLDELETAISFVGKRPKYQKRARIESKENEFRPKLKEICKQWLYLFKSIIDLLTDSGFYETLASDILIKMNNAKNKYYISNENYRFIWEAITTPIISLIMDETELTKEATYRQDRRKLLLQLLMDHEITLQLDTVRRRNSQRVGRSLLGSDEDIDICDDAQNRPDQDICKFHNSCTWESMQIMAIISSAITRHSLVVTESGVDLCAQIHHIMNIVHLIELLRFKLSEIRSDIEKENENNHRTPVQQHLKDMIKSLEEEIRENVSLFGSDGPLCIYRKDLRTLLIQIRVLIQIIALRG